jgi:hypothetical protein
MVNFDRNHKRYNDFNTYLRRLYGCRVQKVMVDAGLTCPNRDGTLSRGGCIYCNPKGSGTGAHERGFSIREQVIMGKIAMIKRYKAKKFLVYFQSFTNTYAPLETLRAMYAQALSVDGVIGLTIGTRPDCVDNPVLELLQDHARKYLIWLEYGLQSIHDDTLALLNRGHDYQCFQRAVAATRGRGIRICAHVILGLPGEDRSRMLQTARALAEMGIDGIKIHLLYVIKGTPLEKWYREARYRCLEQQEYIDLVCDFLEYMPEDMIVQRLTGDPHGDELVAPLWARKKSQIMDTITRTLENRNTRQGSRLEKKIV